MSCDEKNNKGRKKRSKQSSETNSQSHAPKSVENREEGKAVQTHPNSDVTLSQILYNTSKADNGPKAGTPCIDGEQCLLCHKECYDKSKNGELKSQSSNSNGTLVSQVPLWVCPDCRRNIEEEERRAVMEPSLPSSLQDQELKQKPTLNLTLSITTKPCDQQAKCNCQNCKRSCVKQDVINDVAKEKERQQLRCCWGEVRNVVRCIYREAGTSLADVEETVKYSLDENRMKVKVEKLLKSDPAQLFEKLESQAREYVREVKVRLVKYLTSCPVPKPCQGIFYYVTG